MLRHVIVSYQDLLEFARECFRRIGVPEEDAGIIADHLVLANLRGVDSHGVIRIPYYIEGVEKGYVRARSEIRILRETGAAALIDGGRGLGIPVAVKAVRLGIEKARDGGIAVVSVRNLGHVGMLAYYTLKIAEQKLIGLVTANAPARVAPWGGAEPVFGTNPISFGFPAREKPIIIDMATSVIADFKIRLAALKGEKIPEGVALDKSGKPTVDPKEALEGCLLPFGAHKGYSFSLIVEVLSAVLSGAALSKQVIRHPSTQGGFFVMILDPRAFRSYHEYEADLDRLLDFIRGCSPAHGFEEVLLPGEPEDRVYRRRLEEGIPIDSATWRLLAETSARLGVSMPRPRG